MDFPNFDFLVTFFHIPACFYRKPKWSVWSLWTYYTGWILKFVIEKVSYGRKLKIEDFKKLKKSVSGSKIDFWACFQDQNDFKNILDHSAIIPTQFPYKIIVFSIKLAQNRGTSRKNDQNRIKIPVWGRLLGSFFSQNMNLCWGHLSHFGSGFVDLWHFLSFCTACSSI